MDLFCVYRQVWKDTLVMNWLNKKDRQCLCLQLAALTFLVLWPLGVRLAFDAPGYGVVVAVFGVLGPFCGLLLSLISIWFGNVWLKVSGFFTFLLCLPLAAHVLNGAGTIRMSEFWHYWPF